MPLSSSAHRAHRAHRRRAGVLVGVPDVKTRVDAATAARIPVATVTETLTPAGASFQDWQVTQLTELKKALAQATGKS